MSNRKPIISARRTENLEAMLQKLWTLRPEYREKQAFTIAAGVGALIREIERINQPAGSTVIPLADSSPEEANSSIGKTEEENEIEEKPDPLLEAKKAMVAADKMWG